MYTIANNYRLLVLRALMLPIVIMSVGCSTPAAVPTAQPSTTIATEQVPVATLTPAPTLEAEDSEHTLTIDGIQRGYLLHVPPGLVQGEPVPLMVMLHGYSTGVTYIRRVSKMDGAADANGFIGVYPKGMGASWNAGGCCGIPSDDQVDDVGFVREIILELRNSFNLDAKRTYVVGYNVGGMMAYRLGCEMADVFAAFASVSGVLVYDQCQPVNPISLLHIHGLADTAIRFLGGSSNCDLCGALPELPPVEPQIQKFVEWAGCSNSPTTNKEGAISHTVYSGCQSNTGIELYTIDGAEFEWPMPTASGERNFPATQTIWDFFAAHPKP